MFRLRALLGNLLKQWISLLIKFSLSHNKIVLQIIIYRITVYTISSYLTLPFFFFNTFFRTFRIMGVLTKSSINFDRNHQSQCNFTTLFQNDVSYHEANLNIFGRFICNYS